MKEISKLSYYSNGVNSSKNFNFQNNKSKKIKIKPPFKKGLYSYKYSNDSSKNIQNENFFSYEAPNYSIRSIKKDPNDIINQKNIFLFEPVNESLSYSAINLNKYKIVFDENMNNKSDIMINNVNNRNPNISSDLTLDLNNQKQLNINNDEKKNIFEKESRRMMVEFIKILNRRMNNKYNGNIRPLLLENNISVKILNKNNNMKYNDNNKSLTNDKKPLSLKKFDNSIKTNLSKKDKLIKNKSQNFSIRNNIYNNTNKNKKKINMLNFLMTPRILNLIEDNYEKQKFIFMISPHELCYLEGNENFIFQWKNKDNHETENEFNIKEIQECGKNKNFSNRFYMKVLNKDLDEEYNYEIETPSNEICNYYVKGINYLVNK